MRIAAVPAFRNRKLNPYNALLYKGVEQAGGDVVEFGAAVLFGPAPDVLHIHWPEWLFSAPGAVRAGSQAAMFRTIVSLFKSRGTSIVWTAHNLQSHQTHHPQLEKSMWEWFTENLDGWISLTEAGLDAGIQQYPRLLHVPHRVIRHGHYRDAYPGNHTRESARRVLGISQGAQVLATIGRIQPYKRVPMLARVFSELRDNDVRLLIAGKANQDQSGAIRAQNDPRIIFHQGFVPDNDLQLYHRAADAIVLPYQNFQNSGSALMALSFDVPILAPNMNMVRSLQHLLGPDWVHTYDGELTPARLRELLANLPQNGAPDLTPFDWDRIGEETMQFYREVLESHRRQKRRQHRTKNREILARI